MLHNIPRISNLRCFSCLEEEVVEVEDPPPPELPKFWKAVKDNPGDFTGWTYLLQYVEQKVRIRILKITLCVGILFITLTCLYQWSFYRVDYTCTSQ